MSTHDLKAEFAKQPYNFDFFQAVRLIENWHPDKPRIGTGKKASDEFIRFTQSPSLDFPPSAIASYSLKDQNSPPQLGVNFIGMFGTHGPLPLHLTEYAKERIRLHKDSTLVDFINIFHHRMISLFYRSWANSRPTLAFDRPESDKFAIYAGSLMGIGSPAFLQRDALADRAKLHYTGLLSGQTKHPSGLTAIITDNLNIHASIQEFIGEWMVIPQTEQTRLGWSMDLATLGRSALIGGKVWGCQHKFRIKLGSLTLKQYLSLLPGTGELEKLIAIVRNYIGDEYVWDVQLILLAHEVPNEWMLGKSSTINAQSLNGDAQLGWTTWLGPRNSETDADDLLLNPFIRLSKI